jgi:hypothetical protein
MRVRRSIRQDGCLRAASAQLRASGMLPDGLARRTRIAPEGASAAVVRVPKARGASRAFQGAIERPGVWGSAHGIPPVSGVLIVKTRTATADIGKGGP